MCVPEKSDRSIPEATGGKKGNVSRRFALALATGAVAGAALGALIPRAAMARSFSSRANHVILSKSSRVLSLMAGTQTIAQYRVGLGFSPLGHKMSSGDGRTPEGQYFIDRRNARSDFYLSVGISYPNEVDIARARSLGVAPGGDIFIHGEPMRAGNRAGPGPDWTAGCIAVSNTEIEEIWATVPTGTPITILP